MMTIKIFLLLMSSHLTMGAIPGTFFWRPRLSLDLAIPTTEATVKVHQPGKDSIAEGLVVMIDGYSTGMTMVGFAAGITSGNSYPTLSLGSGYFYTNTYRWALRYFSLLPQWLSGNAGNFVETHKLWKRRYFYMDEFVPNWLRYLFPFVKKEEWDQEYLDWQRFKKYSESAFGKHYRWPAMSFRNFKSQLTVETASAAQSIISEEDL